MKDLKKGNKKNKKLTLKFKSNCNLEMPKEGSFTIEEENAFASKR